jgi:DNA-binding LytR/AlgR family response regulator
MKAFLISRLRRHTLTRSRTLSTHLDALFYDTIMFAMNGVDAARLITKLRRDVVVIGLCVVEDTYIIHAFMNATGWDIDITTPSTQESGWVSIDLG